MVFWHAYFYVKSNALITSKRRHNHQHYTFTVNLHVGMLNSLSSDTSVFKAFSVNVTGGAATDNKICVLFPTTLPITL
jgi:hypothetical protein